MYNLSAFRQRVQELYRTSRPYDDGHRPNQKDLAEAVGLNQTELSNRLNGTKGARLTTRDARAIVRVLAEWGALYTQEEANNLLDLLDYPPFSAAELQTPPLDQLTPPVASSATKPAAASPPPTSHAKSNLPTHLTSFVGRDAEIAEVEHLLQRTRLLTITGTGGAGKTRLATEVASRLVANFRDGVFLVELAALNDPTLVVNRVATVLAVREQPGEDLREQLANTLNGKELLLVLDNCEHLISAAAQLAQQLLTSCPELRIIATSREPLRIGGETVWRLPSLSLPAANVASNPNIMARYEAIRLFTERAQAAEPSFTLNAQNAQLVRDICTQLDGIPLALELAAARLRVMTLTDISQRLRDRFRLLVSGERTALPRQQTLQALVDWSYDLLSATEAAVFRRLSVFVGGFTAQAAMVVCASEETPDFMVMDAVAELVDKSLVAKIDNLIARYYLPETIRQYAAAKLAAIPAEQQAVNRWHRDYFLSQSQQASDDEDWSNRITIEHDNFRAALDWSLANDEAEPALRIVNRVARFWGVRGYLSEAQRYLEVALEQGRGRVPLPVAANGWYLAGNLAADAGDYRRGQDLLEQSANIWQQLGDEENLTIALDSWGRTLLYQDEYEAAKAKLQAALQLERKRDQRNSVIFTLTNLGVCALYQGNHLECERLLHEALALSHEYKNKLMQALIQYNLAALELDTARFDSARRYLEQSLKLAEEIGHLSLVARVQHLHGKVEEYSGNLELAATLYRQSLSGAEELADKSVISLATGGLASLAYRQGETAEGLKLGQRTIAMLAELGYRYDIAVLLELLARLNHAAGEYARAAWLLGAAHHLRQTIGSPIAPVEAEAQAQLLAALKAYDPQTFDRYYNTGQTASTAGAISYAIGANR